MGFTINRLPSVALVIAWTAVAVGGCFENWDGYFATNGEGPPTVDGGVDASDASDAANGMDAGDAGDASDVSDASDSGPLGACNPTKPFGVPVIVQSLLTPGGEGALHLSPDELTGFFQQYAGNSTTLYTATRTTVTGDFAPATQLANVNVAASQQDPTLTADGLTLLFASGPSVAMDHVLVATRATTADDFSGAMQLANVDSATSDVQPFLRPDGASLYLVSNRAGGPYAIYRSTGSITGGFTMPVAVTELNTPSGEGTPTITVDDKVIYFSSARAGNVGLNDVWRAERSDTSSPFSTPVNVIEINTSSNDDPSWVSADECRLYMSSDRNGSRHIYLAQRSQ